MEENDTKVKDKGNEDSVASIIEEISGSIITVRTLRGSKKFDIGKLFMIDQDNLSNEFATQASMYVFFAVATAEADRQLAMKSLLYDQEAADADESYRKELDAAGTKYTEAVIKSMIVRDEDCIKVKNEKENAEYELNILKAIVKAFEQRAMMLQSLGSHLRHEYDMQGMNIRDDASARLSSKVTDEVKTVIKRRRQESE
jgi:predicted  nucleic acid-binding Zn-ribbon protein